MTTRSIRALLPIFAVVFAAGACGGDSKKKKDRTGPVVVSTDPAVDATGVPREGLTVRVVFSEVVDTTTVSATSFLLEGVDGNVTGAVAASGSSATFTTTQRLPMLATYNARLTTSITDLAGNPLVVETSWTFHIRDGVWGPFATIGNGADSASPESATANDGNGLAVWSRFNGAVYDIWANQAAPGAAWGTAALLETEAGTASEPKLAVDGAGNVTAVWAQFDGVEDSMWSNRYDPGAGWGTSVLVETTSGIAQYAHVAASENGTVFAVWTQNDGLVEDAWSNRYVLGAGWGTAARIEVNDISSAYFPQIAVDASGNAIAVWSEDEVGGRRNIWANRFTSGSWGAQTLLETSDAGNVEQHSLAMDAAGNAIATWSQRDVGGVHLDVWAARYVPGSGWLAPVLLETENVGPKTESRVAMNAAGDAIAVWVQYNVADAVVGVRSNRFSGGSWGTAETITTSSVLSPDVALDAAGNAITVWHELIGGIDTVMASRYVAGTGWENPIPLEDDDTGPNRFPLVSIGADGDATVVWTKGNSGTIAASRFE